MTMAITAGGSPRKTALRGHCRRALERRQAEPSVPWLHMRTAPDRRTARAAIGLVLGSGNSAPRLLLDSKPAQYHSLCIPVSANRRPRRSLGSTVLGQSLNFSLL